MRSPTMQYQHILFEERVGIARLALNRPPTLNALNRAALEEIAAALDHIQGQATARALLITGQGRAFCSGADLSPGAWGEPPARETEIDAGLYLETHFNPLLERLFALRVP